MMKRPVLGVKHLGEVPLRIWLSAENANPGGFASFVFAFCGHLTPLLARTEEGSPASGER